MAELADAQASGACGLRLVEVRLLSSALIALSALFTVIYIPFSRNGSGVSIVTILNIAQWKECIKFPNSFLTVSNYCCYTIHKSRDLLVAV